MESRPVKCNTSSSQSFLGVMVDGSTAQLQNGENRVKEGYWHVKLCNDTLILNSSSHCRDLQCITTASSSFSSPLGRLSMQCAPLFFVAGGFPTASNFLINYETCLSHEAQEQLSLSPCLCSGMGCK